MRLPLYGFWNGLCAPPGFSVSFAGQKAYLNEGKEKDVDVILV